MTKEKCSICGAKIYESGGKCNHFNKPVCYDCCYKSCFYRKEAGVCMSFCLYDALNLKRKHGCFLGNLAAVEEAYTGLQVLPPKIALETYEYLLNEYRKGILNAELNSNIRIQLAALQRVIEDMRLSGQIKAAI